MTASTPNVEEILATVPSLYRGPGGAVAVVRDGELVSKRVWGFADLDERIAMTPQTQIPICSITKQMLCLVLESLEKNPTPKVARDGGDLWTLLDEELRRIVPQLVKGQDDHKLTVAHLYNMQSGIRDYWAMTTIWGARPEDPFSIAEAAPKALERTKSFHFTPGTEYSYSNVNFHILGRIIESVTGHSFGQLLAERLFIPAEMTTACLYPNTFGHPLPCVGYEGDEQHGHVPAVNRIEWSGDAGAVASLDDMIAYERYLHRSTEDPKSLYYTTSQPQTYDDGSKAAYGYGLAHGKIKGRAAIAHGGALRGFRLGRIHMPEERLSAIILFNHEADSGAATEYVLKKVLGLSESPKSTIKAATEWTGAFLDTETQLSIESEASDDGKITIKYSPSPEKIPLTAANTAQSAGMTAKVDADMLQITRVKENRELKAKRITKASKLPNTSDYSGTYHCADVDATFVCSGDGGIMYGSFEGYLGRGPEHIMRYLGDDVWRLANPRGMDARAPGDWTIVYHRDGEGRVVGATIGCWLARLLEFQKQL